MDDLQRTAYAILRDGISWDGVKTANLELLPDGVYRLARLPGLPPSRALSLPGPYEVEPSGLAAGKCGDLYIADTLNGMIIFRDGSCGAEVRLPGRPAISTAPAPFLHPRGLALFGAATLYVADSGNNRLQALHLPALEPRLVIETGPAQSAGLACDRQGRIYVLGLDGSVRRFYPNGTPDPAFQAALASDPELVAPAFLAVDASGTVYLSETTSNRVLRYDPAGSPLGPLPPGPVGAPSRPRCLHAAGERLFVADAGSGRLWVYDLHAGAYLGPVPGYRGPAAALAAGEDGSLYVKPGLDAAVHRLEAEVGYAAWGVLQAGPLEAGLGERWRRVRVDVDAPAGSQVTIDHFTSPKPGLPPGEDDWIPAAAQDWLVPGTGRCLWLRLRLQSESQTVSPLLLQVQAETSGEDYMDYLPAVYRRREAAGGFLRCWLNLVRSELADLEQLWEDMHLRFDPRRTPEDHLAWLAAWLGFHLPERLNPPEQRELLLRVHRLYLRRGTLEGVADFVELYCGVRPVILEEYRDRRVWVLGKASALGLDTGLAALLPDGILVPDSSPEANEGGQSCAPGGVQRGRLSRETRGNTDPPGLVVGEVLVGQSAPQAADELGQGLFTEHAHRFTVLVPAAALPDPEQRRLLIETLEAEKPAHTDFHLCFSEAAMSVGCQARLGIDAIIAGPPEPMTLGESGLGRDASLEAVGDSASRLGNQAPAGGQWIIR
jgi:phage tail-like protein